jgi:hypothetical protein
MDNRLDAYFERQGDALVVWPTLFQRGWIVQMTERPTFEAMLRQRNKLTSVLAVALVAAWFLAVMVYDISHMWSVPLLWGSAAAINLLPIRFPKGTPRTEHKRSPIDLWRAQARSDRDQNARQMLRLNALMAALACFGFALNPEKALYPFMLLALSALFAIRNAVVATEQRHLSHVNYSDSPTPTSNVSSVQG